MKYIFTNLRRATLISFLLVLPFMILELVNRWNFHQGFPIMLFFVMWILPVAFILILMPIVRNLRAGKSLLDSPIKLLLRVAFLALIAFAWISTLIDQMPCFQCVPLCDLGATMPRLIPASERIVRARALIQKARDLPIPMEGGKNDFSYIAQVKAILQQARDLIKFIPYTPSATVEIKSEVNKIFQEAEQAEKEILH